MPISQQPTKTNQTVCLYACEASLAHEIRDSAVGSFDLCTGFWVFPQFRFNDVLDCIDVFSEDLHVPRFPILTFVLDP